MIAAYMITLNDSSSCGIFYQLILVTLWCRNS